MCFKSPVVNFRYNHVFVWISEQTAVISLYSINWLVFIAEWESVCCAVRTGSKKIKV